METFGCMLSCFRAKRAAGLGAMEKDIRAEVAEDMRWLEPGA